MTSDINMTKHDQGQQIPMELIYQFMGEELFQKKIILRDAQKLVDENKQLKDEINKLKQ